MLIGPFRLHFIGRKGPRLAVSRETISRPPVLGTEPMTVEYLELEASTGVSGQVGQSKWVRQVISKDP